jgi:hypothetical protein
MYSRREIGVALKILDEVTSVDCLQTGNYPETGLWEALNSTSKPLTKVNSLRSNLRPVIALHSPRALRETGLRMCLRRKAGTATLFTAE